MKVNIFVSWFKFAGIWYKFYSTGLARMIFEAALNSIMQHKSIFTCIMQSGLIKNILKLIGFAHLTMSYIYSYYTKIFQEIDCCNFGKY